MHDNLYKNFRIKKNLKCILIFFGYNIIETIVQELIDRSSKNNKTIVIETIDSLALHAFNNSFLLHFYSYLVTQNISFL